jgi:hypothetical protein
VAGSGNGAARSLESGRRAVPVSGGRDRAADGAEPVDDEEIDLLDDLDELDHSGEGVR